MTLTRFQLNAILVAAAQAFAARSLFFPAMAIGQNAPAESSFTTMRIFNDRALGAPTFYTYPYDGMILATANKDAGTGPPTTAFCTK